MLLAGARLELTNQGDDGFFGIFLVVGALLLEAGGADGGGTFATGGLAKGEHGGDGGFGYIVLAGILAFFEGDECEQVIYFEGGTADFLGLGEGGELRRV